MTKIQDNQSADRLYRRYQETRDNIPSSFFSTIKAKTNEVRHEESIHSILQAAKIHNNSLEKTSQQQAQSTEKQTSWFDSLKSKVRFLTTPQFAGTFACLAVVVAVVPFLQNQQSSSYPEVAHLSDCQECSVYLSNATVSTRNANTGQNRLSASTKTAAKLGKISAGLKVDSLNGPEQAVDKALAKLQKLPKSLLSAELNELVSAQASDIDTLSLAIVNASKAANVTAASEALVIANVSIRYAQNQGNLEQAKPTLESAITAFETVSEPTVLQKASLSKLKKALTQPLHIDVTKTIEAASKSLGG